MEQSSLFIFYVYRIWNCHDVLLVFSKYQEPKKYLGVESECDQHEEEQEGPDGRHRKLRQTLRVCDERQTRTWRVDNILYWSYK